jgi:hypothetical protein
MFKKFVNSFARESGAFKIRMKTQPPSFVFSLRVPKIYRQRKQREREKDKHVNM